MQQRCKVVVAYPDGRRLKGHVYDFWPHREFFDLCPRDHDSASPCRSGQHITIHLDDLKAVVFVKDFDGDPRRQDNQAAEPEAKCHGRKLEVTFAEGEKLFGASETYHPTKPGFFLFPANSATNMERIGVVTRRAKVCLLQPNAAGAGG